MIDLRSKLVELLMSLNSLTASNSTPLSDTRNLISLKNDFSNYSFLFSLSISNTILCGFFGSRKGGMFFGMLMLLIRIRKSPSLSCTSNSGSFF